MKKNYIGLIIAVILIVILSNPQFLPLSAETLEAFRNISSKTIPFAGLSGDIVAQLLALVMMVSIIYVVTTVLKFLISLLKKRDRRGITVSELLLSMLRYLTAIVAVIWALAIVGVDLTAILASLGIVGLILGFGAQSLIEDVITGIFIIFEGQYDIGDIIVLDDFRGTVKRIGVRTTTIEDDGMNLKIINNSDIRNLQNRSVNRSLALTLCEVHYDTDLKYADQVLARELPKLKEKHPDLYLSDPVYMGIENMNDSGIELKFKVVVEECNVFAGRRALNRDIMDIFNANGIEVPYPQVVVHQTKD